MMITGMIMTMPVTRMTESADSESRLLDSPPDSRDCNFRSPSLSDRANELEVQVQVRGSEIMMATGGPGRLGRGRSAGAVCQWGHGVTV
jgi:hypothetical protein